MSEPQQHQHLQTLIPKNRPFQSRLTKGIYQGKTFIMFSKKHYKYINILDVRWSKSFSNLFEFTKKFKRIFRLSLDSSTLEDNTEFTSLLQKIIKLHSRHLRYIGGSLEYRDVQKFLPLLTSFQFNPACSNWRELTSRSAYRYLAFNFFSGYEESFNKYKTALSRSFPKLRNLQHLDIEVLDKNVELTFFLLESLNQKQRLTSLKQIRLTISPSSQPIVYLDRFLVRKPEINQALEKIISLKLRSKEWFSFLISAGKFQNLYKLKLELQLSLEKGPWNFEHLSHFHEMINLKEFTFVLRANSVNCEKELFHHFTLPPAMYKFYFVLCDFPWNERVNQESGSLYTQFLVRAKSNHHLKDLNFAVTGSYSYLSDRFACLFIECFTRLSRARYYNYDSENFGDESHVVSQVKPLAFQDFWRAFGSSQKTLTEIQIHSSEIAFSEEISVLETEFPRLERLTLESKVCCVVDFGDFLRNLPSCLEFFKVSGVIFRSQEGLKEFFNGIQEVSAERYLVLDLNVEGIRQDFLVDCLMRYMKEANVKGDLNLHLSNVQAQDHEAFGAILKLALEKGYFRWLKLEGKTDGIIFGIEKHRAISAKNGLFSE